MRIEQKQMEIFIHITIDLKMYLEGHFLHIISDSILQVLINGDHYAHIVLLCCG